MNQIKFKTLKNLLRGYLDVTLSNPDDKIFAIEIKQLLALVLRFKYKNMVAMVFENITRATSFSK